MITPHKPQSVSGGVWTYNWELYIKCNRLKSGKLEEGCEIVEEGSRLQNFSYGDIDQLRFINEQQMRRMNYLPYEEYKIPKVRWLIIIYNFFFNLDVNFVYVMF